MFYIGSGQGVRLPEGGQASWMQIWILPRGDSEMQSATPLKPETSVLKLCASTSAARPTGPIDGVVLVRFAIG